VIKGSSYKFDGPGAIASDGTHVWIASDGIDDNASVTELDAVTGALVQVIKGSRYGFDGPAGITSDGTDVWVANDPDQSITGFPA
jgi:DNA-binding beta-propeller fold protein YncE